MLREALKVRDTVLFVTHVPPWMEVARHLGKPSHPAWLPFFTNKMMGDMIETVMSEYPTKQLISSCGSHSR